MNKSEIINLISRMTLEEKASLMSGKDFWQTKDLPNHNIPSIFLADGPHGIRKQAEAADHLGLNESLKATCFPTAATMANSWNETLGEEVGECLGQEAANQKVNVLLGPGINVKRNPLCGRNFEYFSEDPYLAGKIGAAYIRGIQSKGVSACVKHFAANNQEERRMIVDAVIDERALREIYLTAFEIAVKEGKTQSIMSSYNKLNGVYANESKHLLQEILRDEWGFEGVVVTDWGGNNDRVEALRVGNELEMPTTGGETNLDIIKAVKENRISEDCLDEAVTRLLTLIFNTEEVFKTERKPFDVDKHNAVALKAAEESAVLLKNSNNVLPLSKGTAIAVIGDFAKLPRYQGAGSSVVNPLIVLSAIEEFKKADFNLIGYEQGYKRFGKKNKGLIKKAVKLSSNADAVIVFIGLDELTESEGMDRKSMKLPLNQLELLSALKQTGKKVVAVLSCGSAIEMDFESNTDALLHAYLGGQSGAGAVVNIISGKVNPSGKLAESYPYSYADCSSATNFPGGKASVEYRESVFVGYRYYDTAKVEVRYPFGYGLSYTSFGYSDLKVNDKGVSFVLTNTGDVDGSEIAQLYVKKSKSATYRPEKELKGFKKVFVKAKENKLVEIMFDDYTYRIFSPEQNKWVIESGAYEIMVGTSCQQILLRESIEVAGVQLSPKLTKEKLPKYFSGDVSSVSAQQFQALYGRELPSSELAFVKKNRIIVDENTAVTDLKYAKGFTGRLFAGGLRFGRKLLKAVGNTKTANMLEIGVFNMPVRGLSRMTGGGISWGQLQGLIIMFNGKFFNGLGKLMKEGKIKKRRLKAEKQAAKPTNK